MQKRVRDTFHRLETVTDSITAVLVGMLTLFVSWQVFARYVLHSSQFWAEEFSVVTMIWIGLLGAAGALWTDSHIGLTAVVDRLPSSLSRLFRVGSDLVIAGFSVFLFFHGIQLVGKTMSGTLSSMPIPIGYSYLIVPISAALMVLFSLARAVRRFAGSEAEE